jgi:hypothetical protein
LEFAQGNWALGQLAIGMKDGIVRILPSLLSQTFLRPTTIFDKSITIAVSKPINPVESRFDVGPDALKEFLIACPFKKGSRYSLSTIKPVFASSKTSGTDPFR